MVDVTPVVFENKSGLNLFGILHKPSMDSRKNTGIILVSPGVKMRVAPHRLYNNMADRFSNMGFTVLRFDFYGLGDSEGETQEHYLADLYGSIQLGRYIEDTITAMDWMGKECNISTFVLAGLCGGAITGLLTATQDQRVDALLALGIPIILDSSKVDTNKYISVGQLNRLRAGYFSKLGNIKSWIRFLSFKSNYRVMLKSLMQRFEDKDVSEKLPDIDQANQDNSNPSIDVRLNPLFIPAFNNMLSTSRKLLLIFSGADRLVWEFEERFARVYYDKFKEYSSSYEVYTVKDANHIFSLKEWRQEMMNHACTWLNKYY